ncbi:HNH endonuclease [Actinacidiphila bryophytorum]|uniref:HNH endonuclease n=1 Tax=Actinacidiphila bryophytorum TaxID=1436133 RepID=UPI002176AB71|nr:HNH endonuclease [Actinacidiphila bryophytorum]UWE08267.1 HNH endonuclease [Actinacidiphila bryophytorum]
MAARYTRELLEEAVRASRNIDEAVLHCGGHPTPGSTRYLRRKLAEAGIDASHLTTGGVRHTDSRLRAAVAAASSVTDVLRLLGISQVGGNHAHVSRRIAALGIDTGHFTRTSLREHGGGRSELFGLRAPEEGRAPGHRLRRALIAAGVPEMCRMCGTGPEWNGRPLTLHVDHISGQWWDNRRQNLRLLCPNCHAVTDTYRGRKRPS